MIGKRYEERDVVALYDSIVHWKRDNVGMPEGLLVRIGPEDCALCTIYFSKGCKGCPVMEKTGFAVCGSTPYTIVSYLLVLWRKSNTNTKPKRFEGAVQDEIEFLESLYEEAVGSVS